MILLFTIIAVSVDAYIASIGYSLYKRMSIKDCFYAASFTFFLAFIALIIGNWLSAVNELVLKVLGGGIFIFLGTKNILEFILNENQQLTLKRQESRKLWLLGVAIASDAAIACFSISSPLVLCPMYAFFMFLAHFAFIILAKITVKLTNVFHSLTLASGIILVALGIYKLLL